MQHKVINLLNDLSLLDEMMCDLQSHQDSFYPGPYWLNKQERVLKWLRNNDLNLYRAYDYNGNATENFSGGSSWPSLSSLQKDLSEIRNGFVTRLMNKLGISWRNKEKKLLELAYFQSTLNVNMMFMLIEKYDLDHELEKITCQHTGSPSDLIEYKGNYFHYKFINKFFVYLFLKNFIDFKNIRNVIEVGAGVGLLGELLLKLHPHLKLYLVDIAPQLYVLNQNMEAVFPGKVASYRKIKESPDILKSPDYNIFVLPSWQIKNLYGMDFDLSINQAFEEMSRETVESYLDAVKALKTKHVFINTVTEKKGFNIFTVNDYMESLKCYKLKWKGAATLTSFPCPDSPAVPVKDLSDLPPKLGASGLDLLFSLE